MTNRGFNTFKAGIFIVIALVLFVFSIYFLGREREIFSSQKSFYTAFADVKGLTEGAPVRLGGITIGRVEKITFAEDPKTALEQGQIQVSFGVSEKYLDRIRLDSKISLETQGLLGDKFLSISIGTDPRVAPPESFIATTKDGDIIGLVSKASEFADNSVRISQDLRAISEALSGDESLQRGLKDGAEFLKTANALAKEVQTGSGLLHALIYDRDGANTIKAFGELSQNLAAASRDINQILGTSGSEEEQKSLSDVIMRLNKTAENLELASSALTDGSGTLGALLVDAKLYDNLVEVTDGAKRSFILRQAIRSSMNNSGE